MPKIELIHELTQEKAAFGDFLASPTAYNDPDFTRKTNDSLKLENIIEKVSLRNTLEQQLNEAKELATGNDELAELAEARG